MRLGVNSYTFLMINLMFSVHLNKRVVHICFIIFIMRKIK